MKVKYFEDSDTALVEFKANEIVETREVSESIYIDLDADGNLVSMTIEHAKDKALPHWPAPVSVVSLLIPNSLLYHACATAVLGL